MFICANCGSDQVQRLEPTWFYVNDGRMGGDSVDFETLDTYCDECRENGIEIIERPEND